MPYTRLGVPYQAWRITHANHHAHTGHMTQDQVFVPSTRSERNLPPLNAEKEDLLGSRVSEEIAREFWEALGDSPISAMWGSMSYLVGGSLQSDSRLLIARSLVAGLRTSSGTPRARRGTPRAPAVRLQVPCQRSRNADHREDFNPNSPMFRKDHYNQIMISNAGILIWATVIGTWIYQRGFAEVFRLYLVPYLW